MLLGGDEMLGLTLLLWLLSLWVFYLIIKAAVRNGILEADARRDHNARVAVARQASLEEAKRALNGRDDPA